MRAPNRSCLSRRLFSWIVRSERKPSRKHFGMQVQRLKFTASQDATDGTWLKAVGEKGWIALRRDLRIRFRAGERAALLARFLLVKRFMFASASRVNSILNMISMTFQRKKPRPTSQLIGVCFKSRQRPSLPRSDPRSTIGPEGLNFRVRDGNGCDPLGKAAEKLLDFRLPILDWAANSFPNPKSKT